MTTKPDTLASALVAAQGQLHAPAKNRTVKVKSDKGSYSFDYATLDSIVESLLRPVLPDFGLWFVQGVKDGQMVTTIIHSSGETLDCGVPMPNMPAKPQDAGSLLTYFKRYSLCAAFGLAAEEDDDANMASGNSYQAANKAANGNGTVIDDAQFGHIVNLIEAKGADAQRFCKYLNVASIKAIPASRYQEAVQALQAKPDKVMEAAQ
jgi:hypothetical protein